MKRSAIKREVDLQILGDWVREGARVLDLGCGRGIFLEYLRQTKHTWGLGVDNQMDKVTGCIKRGVSVYQGDIEQAMRQFPDDFFDWVLCSRTLQELSRPQDIIRESLRVGKRFAVGFVNHGYWRNPPAPALARTPHHQRGLPRRLGRKPSPQSHRGRRLRGLLRPRGAGHYPPGLPARRLAYPLQVFPRPLRRLRALRNYQWQRDTGGP